MKILVTLGGTSERIDQVRSITNHSTGKLGNELVNYLNKEGFFVDVIASDSAILPETNEYTSVKTIHNTKELDETLSNLLRTITYDAVIHTMAVSDFTPKRTFSEENFLHTMNSWIDLHPNHLLTSETLDRLLIESSGETETKLSSSTDHLVLFLEKTPKVIQKIKKIQPNTLLVAFKLLVNVSKEELFAVAFNSLDKSNADYVLANDLSTITATSHIGYLLNSNEIIGQATSKREIARLIVHELKKALSQKEESTDES